MPEEKTLLHQIREKEQEVNLHLETVMKESENDLLKAKKEAEEILSLATRKGKASAQQITARERDSLHAELDMMEKNARDQEESIRKLGGQNMSRAVDQIVRYVTME